MHKFSITDNQIVEDKRPEENPIPENPVLYKINPIFEMEEETKEEKTTDWKPVHLLLFPNSDQFIVYALLIHFTMHRYSLSAVIFIVFILHKINSAVLITKILDKVWTITSEYILFRIWIVTSLWEIMVNIINTLKQILSIFFLIK